MSWVLLYAGGNALEHIERLYERRVLQLADVRWEVVVKIVTMMCGRDGELALGEGGDLSAMSSIENKLGKYLVCIVPERFHECIRGAYEDCCARAINITTLPVEQLTFSHDSDGSRQYV